MKLDNWERKLDAEGLLKREMEKKSGKVTSDQVAFDRVAGDKDTITLANNKAVVRVATEASERPTHDRQTFERAMAAGLRDSRFASWSRRGKCVLVLLRETTPKFSMSDMVAEYLEQGLERDHPELLKMVDVYLKTHCEI